MLVLPVLALLPFVLGRVAPAPAPASVAELADVDIDVDVETNGQRLAKGLTPLKPRRNYLPGVKRQSPSGVPTTTAKGFLYAVQPAAGRKRAGVTAGCVISDGTWYVGGSCATYTASITGGSATLSTSKGPCAVSSGALSCAAGNTASTFALASDGTLSYSGSSAFSADQVPANSVRQTVYTGGSHAVALTLNFAAGANTATSGPSSTSSSNSASSTKTSTTSSPMPTGTGLTVCSAQPISSFPLSCSGATGQDTCCTDSPGGHLLLTQFWDTGAASTGPNTSWTLHGLWPDNCDGTYEQFCDTSREYTNITQILQAAGQTDMLSYMNTYWKDYQGNDESFWEHEFNKHGTCISSLEPKCFNNYQPQQDVVIYFQKAVATYKTLPTYDWLAADGIVPSLTATYTLAQIQASIKKNFGHEVNINCNGKVFDEVWYHYVSQGGIGSGNLLPADLVGSPSSCPATGIKYYPKYVDLTGGSSTTTSSSSTPGPSSTGTPAPGAKGFVYPTYADGSREPTACLISDGTWYKGGSCAGYTRADVTGGFTLSTSKGLCGVVSNTITCASTVNAGTAAVFTAAADGTLSVSGNNAFSAAAVPAGSTRQPVSVGTGKVPFTLVFSS